MIRMSTPPARAGRRALVAQVAPVEIDLAKLFAVEASAKVCAFPLVPVARAAAGWIRLPQWRGRISTQRQG